MPTAFNFSASPFDSLSPDEQRLVRNSVDIAYFRSGETILDVGIQPSHLFVIIKGLVHQYEGGEVINTYGIDDCFDGRGLVAEKVTSRFVAAEEVVAYQLAKKAVINLIVGRIDTDPYACADLTLRSCEGKRLRRGDENSLRHGLKLGRIEWLLPTMR